MNIKSSEHSAIPSQKKGTETGAKHDVTTETQVNAHQLFIIARNRLKDINNWKTYSDIQLTDTVLTDEMGTPVNREPYEGDYIKIDIPGPGPESGDGYDWVRIEKIEDNSDEFAGNESFAIRVRPASNPTSGTNDVSHFYTSDASSTFIVNRINKEVSATEAGKNEIANTDTKSIKDNIRNATVATASAVGIASIQWKLLMQGILKGKEG